VARARTTSIVLLISLASIVVDGHDLLAQAIQVFPTAVIWRVEVKSQPIAPLVASADRVFLALQSGVSAHRLTDGGEIWQTPGPVDGPMAASDERLIIMRKGELLALDVTTGKPVWSVQPGPLTAPPLVSGDWLLVASGESIACYRVADGSKMWSSDDTGIVEQRPAISGDRAYIPAADGRILALDLKSGKQIWEFQIGIKPTEPLVHEGRVFAGSEGKLFCSIRPDTGRKDWCSNPAGATRGRPVADARNVYFVGLDNILRAHDWKNGAQRWTEDLHYRPSSGPLLVGAGIAAAGNVPRVPVFETSQGKKTIQINLETRLPTAPLLIEARTGSPARVAAVTGDLQNRWHLTLIGPAAPIVPAIAVDPLTALPGQAIPIGLLPVLPVQQPPAS
jgi:outer membrane protein assembly factor BamB